jgi:hypothetical protein
VPPPGLVRSSIQSGPGKGSIVLNLSQSHLKYRAVTAFLNIGLSIAKQSNGEDVRRLISDLHPVCPEAPMIRLGTSGDGGYLLPDDLASIAACFSPGVDNRITFEKDLVARGIPCHLADHGIDSSVLGGLLVNNTTKSSLTSKFIGVFNDEKTMTLDNWIDQRAPGTAISCFRWTSKVTNGLCY